MKVASIEPRQGLYQGNTEVTIGGSGFREGTEVTVGGARLEAMVVTPTSITGRTPPGIPGIADVVVSAEGGSASVEGGFTFLDREAPRFVVTYQAPARNPVVGATLIDGAASYEEAYRRDETLALSVSAKEVQLDESAVNVFVRGVGPNQAPGATFGPVPVGDWTDCPEGRCGLARVPLWKPQLLAFRGEFGLEVKGRDLSGNEGAARAKVKVTRWKWKRTVPVGQLVRATPAVASDGTVYFGTLGATGSLVAVTPEGALKWESVVGSVLSSPSVGVTGNVYSVFTKANQVVIAKVEPGTGAVQEYCKVADAAAESSPALVMSKPTIDSVSKEAVFAAVKSPNLGVFVVARGPGDCLLRNGAATAEHDYNVSFPGSVVHGGGNFYFGDPNGKIQSLALVSGGLQSRLGWPVGSGLVVRGLAFDDGNVVGSGRDAGKGGVFSIPEAGGAVSWQSPPAGVTAPPAWTPPAIGVNGFITYGDDTPKLYSVKHKDGGQLRSVASRESHRATPLWGEGDLLYTASVSGVLQVRNAQLELQWELEGLAEVEASPTIDCARASGVAVPGAPGILYVAGNGTNGNLYAFVVDSRGLDTRAPWPKYQHDPRNTGSADTSLAEFACP